MREKTIDWSEARIWIQQSAVARIEILLAAVGAGLGAGAGLGVAGAWGTAAATCWVGWTAGGETGAAVVATACGGFTGAG